MRSEKWEVVAGERIELLLHRWIHYHRVHFYMLADLNKPLLYTMQCLRKTDGIINEIPRFLY